MPLCALAAAVGVVKGRKVKRLIGRHTLGALGIRR